MTQTPIRHRRFSRSPALPLAVALMLAGMLVSTLTRATFTRPSFTRVAHAESPEVPVLIGGSSDLDACGSVGEVSGLNPRGDNFLAVRSGPGTRFAKRDELRPGARLFLCDEQGDWLGVVYAPGDAEHGVPASNEADHGVSVLGEADCGVASPHAERTAYAGPCRWGWVARRWVTAIAG